ncbi:hypothetical protein C8R43DRAFT_1172803 [Mycena crocata]|nr:hypothetical protein C8R43DRAFT_1172803 [Mycena crocata]
MSPLPPLAVFGIVFGVGALITSVALIFFYFWRRRTTAWQRAYVDDATTNVIAQGDTPAADPLLPYAPGEADAYYQTHHAYGHHGYHGTGMDGMGMGVGVGMGVGMHGTYMNAAHMARDAEAMAWRYNVETALHAPFNNASVENVNMAVPNAPFNQPPPFNPNPTAMPAHDQKM